MFTQTGALIKEPSIKHRWDKITYAFTLNYCLWGYNVIAHGECFNLSINSDALQEFWYSAFAFSIINYYTQLWNVHR